MIKFPETLIMLATKYYILREYNLRNFNISILISLFLDTIVQSMYWHFQKTRPRKQLKQNKP